MSSQAFKAQVAVGSWAKAPFWPGLSAITKIIQSKMGNVDKSSQTQEEEEAEESENNLSDF